MPDRASTEVMTPGMSGLNLTRILRRHSSGRQRTTECLPSDHPFRWRQFSRANISKGILIGNAWIRARLGSYRDSSAIADEELAIWRTYCPRMKFR